MRYAMLLMLTLTAFCAAAQDGEADARERAAALDLDGTTEDCVRTRSIRSTDVIDDSTIAFHMRDRSVYVNLLPRRCPQLARNDRFAYEVRSSRLCSTDTITVLLQFGGRLEPGFTCRLGQFYLTDEETVEMMAEAAEQGGRASPVSAEPVELPPEAEADSLPEDSQE